MSPIDRYADEVSKTEKVALLRRIDEARGPVGRPSFRSAPATPTVASESMIANTHGLLASDEQVRQNVR